MPDTETLTEEQLKEIEARAKVATPGPWQAEGGQIARREGEEKSELDHMIIRDGGMWAANELFIAHAREDIPALCRSLRAAWAKNADLHIAIAKTWEALGIAEYTGKYISEHVAALRAQNQTQAESIIEFQENEKSLKAQLAQVEQGRTRVINACTEKAAEWDRASWLGDEYAAAKRDALLELAKKLENL